jgi:hypothetical protein
VLPLLANNQGSDFGKGRVFRTKAGPSVPTPAGKAHGFLDADDQKLNRDRFAPQKGADLFINFKDRSLRVHAIEKKPISRTADDPLSILHQQAVASTATIPSQATLVNYSLCKCSEDIHHSCHFKRGKTISARKIGVRAFDTSCCSDIDRHGHARKG